MKIASCLAERGEIRSRARPGRSIKERPAGRLSTGSGREARPPPVATHERPSGTRSPGLTPPHPWAGFCRPCRPQSRAERPASRSGRSDVRQRARGGRAPRLAPKGARRGGMAARQGGSGAPAPPEIGQVSKNRSICLTCASSPNVLPYV